MPLPPTCTVTGNWLNPDETPATGQVVITPVAVAPGPNYIVVARPIAVVLVAGAISVTVANNTGFPSLQYQISEQIDGTSTVDYIVTPTGTTVNLSTAPRSAAATATLYVLAAAVGHPGGVASLDGTGKVPVAQIPAGSGVTITSPDATITVGGTSTAPTVVVAAIGQSQVTGLPAALSANTAAITAETSRAQAAEATKLAAANNLSDVGSATAALGNLGGVPAARTITAGTGLTGGGDLTANRSLAVAYGTAAGTAAQGNDTRLGLAASAVQSVTAANGTITVAGTGTAPTVAVGTISETQVTGLTADLGARLQSANNLSDLASAATSRGNLGLGTAATISATAGGDLSGTLPSPTVARVNGVTVTGTPSSGQVIAATSSSAAAWSTPATTLPPSGAAGGDLGGSYPNPTVTVTHLSAALPLAQGGTGATTQNFVDLTTPQTVGGTKTFSAAPVVPAASFPESAVTGLTGDLAARLVAANNLADVATAASALSNLGGVPGTRTVTAGTGLTGGGDLTADRSFAVTYGTTTGSAAQGNDSRITGALQSANNLADVAAAGTARTNLGVQALYTATATQTGTYTASAWQVVPCNATAGSFTVTLPTGAPAGAQVAVNLLATAGTNTVTVAAGGTDVINQAGTTSVVLSLPAESFEFTSNGSGTWYIAGGQKSLASLDTRYGAALNVLNYGARRNYATSATGAMTASSATLTDTNAAFTAANVGQYVTVVGAGAAGVDLSTTIVSVTSSTAVVLTVAASTTVSGATYAYGTNDAPAINAAITAAGASGASVLLPPGGYVLGTSITPASNVSLLGSGIGNTVLYPFGTTAAVLLQATSGTPLTNFTAAHFTVDGARQAGAYSTGVKGIFLQYTSHLTLEDLVVQNCVATGIGTDFLAAGSTIHNCRAINNGRLNHAGVNGGGGNGIGIGTGGYTVEDWVISDCYATSNGRYGIMLENQFPSLAAMSTGMRIANCYSSANFGHGYGDAGGSGVIWSNCVAASNSFDGFSIDNGTVGATAQPSGNSVYSGCVATANSRYGFSYQPTASNTQSVSGAGNHLYVGCKSFSNTSLGFNINSVSARPVSGMTYQACEAYSNGASGWQVQGASNDIKITDCKANANGQVSSTSKVGILIGANVTGLHIAACRVYDDGSPQKQAYGLQISTGVTVTTATVVNNDLRGNLTGSVNMLGTWASAVLDANPGYDGTATRSAGPASAGRVRPDTVANWITNNPTLGLGELGFETDTRQIKIGDGATTFTNLNYAAPAYLDQLAATAIAAVAVTMDPMNAQGSPGITTGRPYFCLAHIAAYQTITAMDIDIIAVGATTTVSTTFMGVYDVATGNLLGQTADFSASLPAGQGTTLLKVNLTSTIAAQNIGRPVYLCFLTTLAGAGASLTVIGGRQFGSNQSAASPNGRLFTNSAGTTLTALPGTVPTLVQTSGFSMPYLGAYH